MMYSYAAVSMDVINKFKCCMLKKKIQYIRQILDVGTISWFLGMEIKQNDGITGSKLEKFGLINVNLGLPDIIWGVRGKWQGV